MERENNMPTTPVLVLQLFIYSLQGQHLSLLMEDTPTAPFQQLLLSRSHPHSPKKDCLVKQKHLPVLLYSCILIGHAWYTEVVKTNSLRIVSQRSQSYHCLLLITASTMIPGLGQEP